jgi:hypothetical protein
MIHVPRLLDRLGIGSAERVRTFNAEGSKVRPHLLARYAVAPRVGGKRGNAYIFSATPTALFVAMDPENFWDTPDAVEEQRQALRDAVRREVVAQGAKIRDDELDTLVHVSVWGDQKYELANFTDKELVHGLASVFETRRHRKPNAEWVARAIQSMKRCRDAHEDIKSVFKELQLGEDKPALAQALLPALLRKFDDELAQGVITPVIKLVLDVHATVDRLSRSGYVLIGDT